MHDPNEDVRCSAAGALNAQHHGYQPPNALLELAIPALIKALSMSWEEPGAFLALLAIIGPPAKDAVPQVLRLMLTAKRESIRELAADTLKQIDPDGNAVAEDLSSIKVLEDGIHHQLQV